MEDEDSKENTNTMSNQFFIKTNQSSDRLSSLFESTNTVGLDELMNLLKN
jgi:hypothetical protein